MAYLFNISFDDLDNNIINNNIIFVDGLFIQYLKFKISFDDLDNNIINIFGF